MAAPAPDEERDDDNYEKTYIVTQLDRATFKIKFELQEKYRDGIHAYQMTSAIAYTMRQLNKIRLGNGWFNKTKLDGVMKRELAVTLIMWVLVSFGEPGLIAHYQSEAIVNVIEFIYLTGIHRLKSIM